MKIRLVLALVGSAFQQASHHGRSEFPHIIGTAGNEVLHENDENGEWGQTIL